MGARTSYKSKHRDEILKILRENEREHMTAGQILDELKARGVSIGVATIYRQLDRLVEEGAVNKYMVDAKVVHIERKAVETAMQGFSGGGAGGFELDCTRTLFYGICGDCRRKK